MSTPHVFDQWKAATGQEKRSIYSAHKAEIRAEARRRDAVAASRESKQTEASGGQHVLDRWLAATGSARMNLFREHRAEIRVEANRRLEGDAK